MATKVKAKAKISTKSKIAIGVVSAIVIGGVVYLLYRKSKIKKECIAKGGVWDSKTKQCKMPSPIETKKLKDAYDNLLFETGKDVIKQSSYPSLDEVVDILKKQPNWTLSLIGYTDSSGNKSFNLDLSKKRALAVKNYLVSKGISPDRLTSDGLGSNNPIADNSTSEGRSKNRRVEFNITKN